MQKKVYMKISVFRSSTTFFACEKFLCPLQNRVQAPHLFLEGDALGWGAPGLGNDLGWSGEATRDAQRCGGGHPPLGLPERDISVSLKPISRKPTLKTCPNHIEFF